MPRRSLISIALTISLAVLLVFLIRGSISGAKEYGYVFYESTGQNQYILINSIEMPIHFDTVKSNSLALNALYSLSPRVLYPNSKGGKISVVGEYDPKSQLFALQHWYIRVPFVELTLIDGIQVDPGTIKEITRYSLERTDFDARFSGLDPDSLEFSPIVFEKH